jgi:opacity protein-like surface antigen
MDGTSCHAVHDLKENTGMLRIIILFIVMLSNSVFAATGNEIASGNQFFIGLIPGVTWVTGNKTQTFYLQPDVEKTYTADNNANSFPSGEIFLGWQKPFSASFIRQSLLGQLGISIVEAGNAKLSGNIWEDADPDFNNYIYNYKINHTHLALKGRLISNSNLYFEPYLSGSLGVGFNRAYNFTIQPIIAEEVAAPPFNSNTTTTFIYTLGIGLQKSLTSHLQVALGYEFADWGKTQLSRAYNQTLNQGLTLNHLYANQIQLSLIYLL